MHSTKSTKRIDLPFDELRKMYVDEQLNYKEIASHFDVSWGTVRKKIILFNIPRRPKNITFRRKTYFTDDGTPCAKCVDCKAIKPLSDFWIGNNFSNGHNGRCKVCGRKHASNYYHNHNKISDSFKTRNNRAHTLWRRRIKMSIFSHYSNGTIQCADPYHIHPTQIITDMDILTLDHINGGGYQDKIKNGKDVYLRLIKAGYPPGFQILCCNCQAKKVVLNGERRQKLDSYGLPIKRLA